MRLTWSRFSLFGNKWETQASEFANRISWGVNRIGEPENHQSQFLAEHLCRTNKLFEFFVALGQDFFMGDRSRGLQ